MSRVPAIASGWFATIPTGRPSIVAKPVTRFGRPALAQLERARRRRRSPPITVRARRSCRSTHPGAGRPPRGAAGRADRRVGQRGSVARRRARGQGRQQLDHRLGSLHVVDDERRRAGVPGVHVAPPSSFESMRTPVNSVTIVGPLDERVRVGGHDRRGRRGRAGSAGPETAGPGPGEHDHGTMPERSASALPQPAPAVECRPCPRRCRRRSARCSR